MTLKPPYWARFEPVFPCSEMPTRHCPASYAAVCSAVDRPCARYRSEDPAPWWPELLACGAGEPCAPAAWGCCIPPHIRTRVQ